MEQIARVVSVNKGTAKLEIRRASACGDNCVSCKGGCTPTNTYVEAKDSIGVQPGQLVKLELETNVFIKSVLFTYGIPLLMLIIGIMGTTALIAKIKININSDIVSFGAGIALMAVSLYVIRQIDKKYKNNNKIAFKIIGIKHT